LSLYQFIFKSFACEAVALYADYSDQKDLVFLGTVILDQHWLIVPGVFGRNYPAGKPANHSPGSKPQNKF
jgi:hypothetical protein